MKTLLILVLSLIFASTATSQSKLASILGTVNPIDQRHSCLAIKNASLKIESSLQIVLTDKPQRVVKGSVDSKQEKSCSSDIDSEPGLSFYKIKLRNSNDAEFGIGVVKSDRIKVSKGFASVNLAGDRRPEYFRVCASNEGLHVTAWTGKPLIGKRIWHTYYYLNYDTDPTCKTKDYKGTDD